MKPFGFQKGFLSYIATRRVRVRRLRRANHHIAMEFDLASTSSDMDPTGLNGTSSIGFQIGLQEGGGRGSKRQDRPCLHCKKCLLRAEVPYEEPNLSASL